MADLDEKGLAAARKAYSDSYWTGKDRIEATIRAYLAALPDRPQAKGKKVGVIAHMDHGKTALTSAVIRALTPPAPADIDHAPDHGGAPAAGVTEGMVEAVAQAIFLKANPNAQEPYASSSSLKWLYEHYARAALEAALSHRAQEADGGWVRVPKEPTEAMKDAVTDVRREYGDTLRDNCADVWRAMLAAAPSSTSPKGSDDAE
jgi:hypothetical protein